MIVKWRLYRSTDEQIQSNEGIWAWIEEMTAEILEYRKKLATKNLQVFKEPD